MIESVVNAWTSFWFSPANPFDLGCARLIIVGYFLFFKSTEASMDFAAWNRVYNQFGDQWQPPWLMRKLGISVAPGRHHRLWVIAYRSALFLTTIGLVSQISAAIALVCGIYLKSIRHGIRPHHPIIPIHFCLLAFTIAPSGAAFSMDAYIGIHPLAPADLLFQLSGWGIRLVQVTMALMVFATGFSKIRNSSATFTFWQPGHLSDLLRMHDFPFIIFRPLKSMSGMIHASRPLEFIFAAGTVAVELAYPLVLFFPATQCFLIGSFFGMVLGFRIFIGARFDFIVVSILAAHIPWSELLRGQLN